MTETKRKRGRPPESPTITWTKARPQLRNERWSEYIRYRVQHAWNHGKKPNDISIYRLSMETKISQPNLSKFAHGELTLGRDSLERIATYMGILAK